MELLGYIGLLPLAAESGGEESGGSFLVSPGLGLMIWTLVLFLITMWVLKKFAFPKIQEALDRRAKAMPQLIETAEHHRRQSDEQLPDDDGRPAPPRQQRARNHMPPRQGA